MFVINLNHAAKKKERNTKSRADITCFECIENVFSSSFFLLLFFCSLFETDDLDSCRTIQMMKRRKKNTIK